MTDRTPTEIIALMRARTDALRAHKLDAAEITISVPDHVLNRELQASVFEAAAMLGELFVALVQQSRKMQPVDDGYETRIRT